MQVPDAPDFPIHEYTHLTDASGAALRGNIYGPPAGEVAEHSRLLIAEASSQLQERTPGDAEDHSGGATDEQANGSCSIFSMLSRLLARLCTCDTPGL